jgi:hypothetical protein
MYTKIKIGWKKCYLCKTIKECDSFYKSKTGAQKRRGECKQCSNNVTKNYQAKYPELKKTYDQNHRLKNIFGITIEQYTELGNKHGWKCCICEKTETENKRKLAIDHDHSTGRIRGILCGNCNRGIGNLKDSVSLLQKAINYLTI